MRWYTLEPSLADGAKLRVRSAPMTDASIRTEVKKGVVFGAVGNLFEVDENGKRQQWLPVLYEDEYSGDDMEGFMMARMPDGRTPLLVPWDEAGFIACRKVIDHNALAYESPDSNGRAIGHFLAGDEAKETTVYGVIDATDDYVLLCHQQYGPVWVDARDTEVVCERLHHDNCSVAHSFFTYNDEMLPENGKILIREFPSGDSESAHVLRIGGIIEATERCGGWLRLTGEKTGWCRLEAGDRLLVREIPNHSSPSCKCVLQAIEDDEGNHDERLPTEDQLHVDQAEVVAESGAFADEAAKDESQIDLSQSVHGYEPSSNHGDDNIAQQSELAELDERNKDSNSHDSVNAAKEATTAVVDSQDQTLSEMPTPSSWDETPIQARASRIQSWTDDAVQPTQPETTPATLSWEDRPIRPATQSSFSWEEQPIRPTSATFEVEPAPTMISEGFAAVDDHEFGQGSPVVIESVDDQDMADDECAVPEGGLDRLHTEPSEDVEELAVRQDPQDKEETKEWFWEEAPIKSRHAQQQARELGSEETPSASPIDSEQNGWAVLGRRQSSSSSVEKVEDANDGITTTHDVPVLPPVAGVVAEDLSNISWHSSTPEEAHEVATVEIELKEMTPQNAVVPHHSPMGIVSADQSTISWHSNDASEDIGVFADSAIEAEAMEIEFTEEDVTEIDAMEVEEVALADKSSTTESVALAGKSSTTESVASQENEHEVDAVIMSSVTEDAVLGSDLGDQAVNTTSESHDSSHQEAVQESDADDDAERLTGNHPEGSMVMHSSAQKEAIQAFQPHPSPAREPFSGERPLNGFKVEDDRLASSESEDEEDFVIHSVNLDEEINMDMSEPAPVRMQERTEAEDNHKLREKLATMPTNRPMYGVVKAIALAEGLDAILEALASSEDYDPDLLSFESRSGESELPATVDAVAPLSPSNSSSDLLNVLYSRTSNDGFSTPKKQAPTTRAYPQTPESGKDRMAGILRRTPQKAKDSFSKILNNGNPEDILMAEFGSYSDELGLFGGSQYPETGLPVREQVQTPSKALFGHANGVGSTSLQKSSSFRSPLPKENPLKRSASAIAKTPPVPPPAQLPRPLPATSQPTDMAPTCTAHASSMEAPAPVKAKPASLVPPATKPTLQRPSLAALSTTSLLRRPVTPSFPSPTPSARSSARSFGASDEAESKISPPPANPPPATEQARTLPRAQSMLPRKTMIPAPGPSKLGLPRTNALVPPARPSVTAASAQSRLSSLATEAHASRRASFGFSQPAPIAKK